MKTKQIIYVFIFAIVLGGIYFYTKINKPQQQVLSTETAKNQIVFLQEVDFRHKRQQATMHIPEGSTAYDALKKFASVKITGSEKSPMIVGINNEIPDQTKHEFWAFYVNGKPSEVGAGQYILKKDDHILWKIDTY